MIVFGESSVLECMPLSIISAWMHNCMVYNASPSGCPPSPVLYLLWPHQGRTHSLNPLSSFLSIRPSHSKVILFLGFLSADHTSGLPYSNVASTFLIAWWISPMYTIRLWNVCSGTGDVRIFQMQCIIFDLHWQGYQCCESVLWQFWLLSGSWGWWSCGWVQFSILWWLQHWIHGCLTTK